MSVPLPPSSSLELERERTVQALCAHYGRDHLTTQELELRFERVYRAASLAELRAITTGLPALAEGDPSIRTPMYEVATRASAPPREKRFLALMSDVRRQGLWDVPNMVKAKAYMGAIRLDLREAVIPPDGVDVDVTAVMAEVRIILPPGVRADVDGMAIMGEFSGKTVSAGALDGAAPVVRVRGEAVLGAVRVETRLPHESKLDAWKRRMLGR